MEQPTPSAMIAGLCVCELDGDEEWDPPWDPIPEPANRCPGVCDEHHGRCAFRLQHRDQCKCRKCLIYRVDALVGMQNYPTVYLRQLRALIDGDDSEDDEPPPVPKVH